MPPKTVSAVSSGCSLAERSGCRIESENACAVPFASATAGFGLPFASSTAALPLCTPVLTMSYGKCSASFAVLLSNEPCSKPPDPAFRCSRALSAASIDADAMIPDALPSFSPATASRPGPNPCSARSVTGTAVAAPARSFAAPIRAMEPRRPSGSLPCLASWCSRATCCAVSP
jgi:hypothetical protein